MNSEQEKQIQRVEDKFQELDRDIRFLDLQLSKIEKMIRTALEQLEQVDMGELSTS
jgi:hypothetical protein